MTTMLYTTNKLQYDVIPFTNNLIIQRNGIIIDGNSGDLIKQFKKPNGYWVNLPIKGAGSLTIKIATLTSIVFKGNKLPWKLWRTIELFFKDDNVYNVDPNNIAHQMYPDNFSIIHDNISYKFISGFTNYGISNNGEILYIPEKIKFNTGSMGNGYYQYTLFCDVTNFKASPSRHRLMCLAYKDYPKEVDDMDVNHENGIKGDDWLDNLEWVTKKRNAQHAVESGLVSNTRRFLSYNIEDDTITKWRSLNECADSLGSDRLTIYTALTKDTISPVLTPHHRYAYESEESEINWPKEPPTNTDMIKRGTLKLFNLAKELVWEGINFKELSESKYGIVTGLSNANLLKRWRRLARPTKDHWRYNGRFVSVIPEHTLEIHLGGFISNGVVISKSDESWIVPFTMK